MSFSVYVEEVHEDSCGRSALSLGGASGGFLSVSVCLFSYQTL